MTIRSRCVAPLLVPALSLACAAPSSAPAPVVAPLETVLDHGCFFVTLVANGREPLLFLLDTGANASAIDTATAARLALPHAGRTTVDGTLGTIEVDRVRVDRLAAGPLEARDLVTTCSDLSGSLVPPGARLDGILASDFLASFAVTLDFATPRVTLTKGALDGDAIGRAIPFQLDDGIVTFDAVLDDGVATRLRLDTGASLFATDDVYLNVTERDWSALRARDPSLAVVAQLGVSGTGGAATLDVTRLHSLALGPLRIDHPFAIVQPSRGYFASPDAHGFFGNNLLEKDRVVVVDYPRRMLRVGAAAVPVSPR